MADMTLQDHERELARLTRWVNKMQTNLDICKNIGSATDTRWWNRMQARIGDDSARRVAEYEAWKASLANS